MITDERITAYINSLDSGDGALCDEIAREAEKSHVPVIRRETAALLKTMVALKNRSGFWRWEQPWVTPPF